MKKERKMLIPIVASLATLYLFGFTIHENQEIVQFNSQSKSSNANLKEVQAEVYINAPINEVWLIIGQNFDQNSKFSVEAKETYYLKEVEGMIGSQRRTVNYKDKVIDVEITEYAEENNHVKWEIFNMNVAPLKAGNSSYTLRRDGKGGTILLQKAAFK